MQVIIMMLYRVIWAELGIKKPPKNEDAQRGLGGVKYRDPLQIHHFN